MKEFTTEELTKYDGKDGRPAYVAKDGKVYDVTASKLWPGGAHMSRHKSGADLTGDFSQAPHEDEVLARVPQVGLLASTSAGDAHGDAAKTSSPARPAVPAWATTLLRFHPHPIMVHFPQAAFTFAPLFLVLSYVFKAQYFERTAFYMLFCGLLSALPAFVTGILHWVYKYGMASGGVYKFKLFMSQVLIVLSLVTTFVHHAAGHLDVTSVNMTVTVLYLLLLPVAAALGHAGGIIVFGPGK